VFFAIFCQVRICRGNLACPGFSSGYSRPLLITSTVATQCSANVVRTNASNTPERQKICKPTAKREKIYVPAEILHASKRHAHALSKLATKSTKSSRTAFDRARAWVWMHIGPGMHNRVDALIDLLSFRCKIRYFSLFKAIGSIFIVLYLHNAQDYFMLKCLLSLGIIKQ
jgi:hypothetical protein